MMKTPSASEDELPHFPALTKCLLIDARYGSRVELIKDLKASALFEEIAEAKSLNDGFAIIESQEVDACFLGPSVTFEKASEFIQQAKKRGLSGDSAYIVITGPECDDHELFEKNGAHGIIQRPYSRRFFTENVVRAVVKANANSPWQGILLDASMQQVFIPNAQKHSVSDSTISESLNTKEKGQREERAKKTDATEKSTTALLSKDVVGNNIVSTVFASTTSGLKQIIARIDDGELGLDHFGTPDKKAEEAIHLLVENSFQGQNQSEDSIDQINKFRQFLEAALQDWFVDVITMSQRLALENLRQRLRMFRL